MKRKMEISKQVCTKEQGKRLQELGVKADNYFVYRHWRGNGQVIIDRRKDRYFDYPKHKNMPACTKTICPAYTVAELGEMLPEKVNFKIWKDCFVGTIKSNGQFYCRVTKSINDIVPIYSEIWDTEAQARAAMLIYLLESGQIKVEQLNTAAWPTAKQTKSIGQK